MRPIRPNFFSKKWKNIKGSPFFFQKIQKKSEKKFCYMDRIK